MAARPCGARGSGLKAFSRSTKEHRRSPRVTISAARASRATWAPLVLLGHRGRPRQDTATQVARSPTGCHFLDTKWLWLSPILTNHLHFLSETEHSSTPFYCFAFPSSSTQSLPTSSEIAKQKQMITIFVLLSCVASDMFFPFFCCIW